MKGFRNFDVEGLYQAMMLKATQSPPAPHRPSEGRFGLSHYLSLGYIPADLYTESVSNTLELAYDDWCLAQFAHALGKEEDAAEFSKRAGFYANLFDRDTQFMRPRLADGSWLPGCQKEPTIARSGSHSWYDCFDPLWVGRRRNRHYTESNAWQYLWSVPHDVDGLIALFGGRENFIARLDTFFAMTPEITGPKYVGVVGTIGQYVHGNQPSHHVPYLYNYAGAPWKTQERVRQIMDEFYRTGPGGICGNEDMGSLSSWYAFSALGFYPVCPGQNVYAIGSPLFEKAVIHLQPPYAKRPFIIRARHANLRNKYIQSARLNGKDLNAPWLLHSDIVAGGSLELEMGPEANKSWGTASQLE
jgi:predicted alpha-1,2-mannosidase